MTTFNLADKLPAVSAPQSASRSLAGLRIWLGLLVVLVFGMVVLGGATRLTGSGLSITEWRPVAGTLPPLSEQAWQVEFSKYRASPQYQIQNAGMELPEFKQIYWWEWSHRQLGRAIGVVFGVGFLLFAGAGVLRGRRLLAVGGLGLLGGLQGAFGWIMVKSGLQPGMTAVAPVKLMLHLVTASLIFTGLVAMFVSLGPQKGRGEAAGAGLRRGSKILLALVLLQIALGALVAGSKAGLVYNTWPLMEGRLIPPLDGLLFVKPAIENLVDNHLTVQFNHRMMAYALFALALWHVWTARRASAAPHARRRAAALAGLVAAQAGIGIATLLAQAPLGLALLHQACAMLVLGMAAVHWQVLREAPPA